MIQERSFLFDPNGADEEHRELFETLEGEEIQYQLLEVYFVFNGQREAVLVFLTNYRLITKSKSFTETWMVPYGLIESVKSSSDTVTIYCKDVRIIQLAVNSEFDMFEKFVSLLKSRSRLKTIQQSFAFSYASEIDADWEFYDSRSYFVSLLRSTNGEVPSWFMSDINQDYKFSPTYPSYLCLPWSIYSNEKLLQDVRNFRSKARIPVLTWKHPKKPSSLTRCSQPNVGLTLNSSDSDKQYLEAIRLTNPLNQTLYIMDARPLVNAMGNVLSAQGGYETGYKNCKVDFLNIENIHVVQESYQSLCNLMLKLIYTKNWDDSDWYHELSSTGWLKHIQSLLKASQLVTDLIMLEDASVVIHCSDGWDRTAQLAALAQIQMDPHFRTYDGFYLLIEKEFCSFGHRFKSRLGHLEKKENETSPIFLQWIDCVWQILVQHPTAFEFNELFLKNIVDTSYSCLYGNFLANCEQERNELKKSCKSFWGWLSNENVKKKHLNPKYEKSNKVLKLNTKMKTIRLWEGYWCRWDYASVV